MPRTVLSSSNPPFYLLSPPADLKGGSVLLKEARRGEVISGDSQKVAQPGFEAKFVQFWASHPTEGQVGVKTQGYRSLSQIAWHRGQGNGLWV